MYLPRRIVVALLLAVAALAAPARGEAATTILPGTWRCSTGDAALGCASRTIKRMPTRRDLFGAATGSDGRIYAVGGSDRYPRATVQAYSPSTNTWTTVAPLHVARWALAVVEGPDGKIYALGGVDKTDSAVSTVEVYTPSTNSWAMAAPMPVARAYFGAAVGSDGRIYAVGGCTTRGCGSSVTSRVDAYTLSTNSWVQVASMSTPRSDAAVVEGPDGRIYAIAGSNETGVLNSVEAYTPSADTWAPVASLSTARDYPMAAVGSDNRIYVIGGLDSTFTVLLNSVETFSPSTDTWNPTAPEPTGNGGAAAAVAGGQIYVIGGGTYLFPTGTVEAYTPSTWTTVAPEITARTWEGAVTGPDGRIYAIGGDDEYDNVQASVEAYTPNTNTWTSVASMPTARFGMGAAVGPDGRIYAIGGGIFDFALNAVEAYSTSSNTWTSLAPLLLPASS